MAFHHLTPRQREIADLICLHDMSIVAVAQQLRMPVATVRAHVRDIAIRLPNPYGYPAKMLIRSFRGVMLAAERERAAQAGRAPSERAKTA